MTGSWWEKTHQEHGGSYQEVSERITLILTLVDEPPRGKEAS
jgi:hypothetical protein